MRGLPVIVMIGRPNVGKSTLFNRLTRSRQALVAAVPGTTRDRREADVQAAQFHFRLVDTGGMAFGADLAFSSEIEAQVGLAAEGAALIWVVLDVTEGLNPFDVDLHRWVIRQGKPYLVVVNKADNPARRRDMAEFYALGSDALHAVSSLHGIGIDGLLEASAEAVPELRREVEVEELEAEEEGPLRVAFLGRPNVGKSSLVNRILGEGRMIVSGTAGTTRESVDVPFAIYGREYVLVDTAGIRRRARTKEYLDKLGALHALGTLERVDVAVIVLDASEDVAAQDARIANAIVEHRRAVVVALNKWDTIRGRDAGKAVEEAVRDRLRFLPYAAVVRTSAVDGSGMEQLFKEIARAAEQFRRRIQTADINRVVEAAVLRFPPPAKGRAPTRVFYGLQTGRCPPRFAFYTNHPEAIGDSYTRFFENQLRYHFGLQGTPISVQWRARGAGRARPRKRPRR